MRGLLPKIKLKLKRIDFKMTKKVNINLNGNNIKAMSCEL